MLDTSEMERLKPRLTKDCFIRNENASRIRAMEYPSELFDTNYPKVATFILNKSNVAIYLVANIKVQN